MHNSDAITIPTTTKIEFSGTPEITYMDLYNALAGGTSRISGAWEVTSDKGFFAS